MIRFIAALPHTHAIATLSLLFFALSSISILSSCSGLSSASPSQRRKKNDFAGTIVEDVVVREVVAKGIIKPVMALNSRQKSFKQRDPIISLNMNLDYLAKSNQKHAAERCEEMLLRIESLHSDGLETGDGNAKTIFFTTSFLPTLLSLLVLSQQSEVTELLVIPWCKSDVNAHGRCLIHSPISKTLRCKMYVVAY